MLQLGVSFCLGGLSEEGGLPQRVSVSEATKEAPGLGAANIVFSIHPGYVVTQIHYVHVQTERLREDATQEGVVFLLRSR